MAEKRGLVVDWKDLGVTKCVLLSVVVRMLSIVFERLFYIPLREEPMYFKATGKYPD